MKKITIVGGGISGCIAALYLSEKGHKVQIYESSSSLGGVMKDVEFENDLYLSGPHYLGAESEWFKTLLKNRNFNNLIRKINYKYSSFNDLFEEELFVEDFAHPTTKIKFKGTKKKNYSTLISRIQSYQKDISIPLQNWLKKFTKKYHLIHKDCSKTLAIGRILFQNDIHKIKLIKNSNKNSDELLGLPNLNYLKRSAYIPLESFNSFFLEMKKILIKNKVEINLNKKVLLKKNKSKKLSIFSDQIEIGNNHVLWTANPVPLIKNVLGEILDNPFTKCFLIFLNFEKYSSSVKDEYIQVFSKNSNLTRIFIYKKNNKINITAEGIFDKKNNIENEISYIKKILFKIYPNDALNENYRTKSFLKHNLFTVRDYKLMKKLKSKKFINGAWDKYDRDSKIISVINNLKEAGL